MVTGDLPQEYGYCEARVAGTQLFCSGQIGLELDGSVPADPGRQYELAFAALKQVLGKHGLTEADVVDLTTFHTQYPSHMDVFMMKKAEFLGASKCCWTAIGVTAVGYPGTLVEIKAIARLRTQKQ